MSRPTIGSVFSGVEGFGQGLEAAGFDVLWQIEIDRDATSVLERHYPNVRRYRDVREVRGSDLPAVDVLVGGFPCQDLSVAGARQGLAGERSGLFYEIARLARELATPWLLLENVDGLLSSWVTHDPPPKDLGVGQRWESDESSSLGLVLSTLHEYGYLGCLRVLDAQYLGVAQRRRRVFIVGHLGDSGARALEVLLEPESVLRDLASCLQAREGAPAVSEEGAGSGGVKDLTYSIQDAREIEKFQGSVGVSDGVMYTLDSMSRHAVAHTLRSHPRPGSNTIGNDVPDVAFTLPATNGRNEAGDRVGNAWNTTYVPMSGESVRDALTAHGGSHGRIDAEGETFVVAAPLTAGGHPNSNMPGRHREDDVNLVASFHEAQITSAANRTRVEPGRPADTLNGDARASVAFQTTHALTTRSGATEDGTGRGTPRVASPGEQWSVRRLMPVECERLMGWAPGWTERRADGSLIPDGPRYRLIGNGVVKNVSEWIGRRLYAALSSPLKDQP